MAAYRCVDFVSPLTLLPSEKVSLKTIRCRSSISVPLTPKSSKRKNYLRPKILRTLNPKPEEPLLIGVESTENVPPRDVFFNQDNVVEELQGSVVSKDVNGILSRLSPKVVAKYGLYLIGIFAFQTVCAVLFLGDSRETSSDIGYSSSSSSSSRSLNLKGKHEGSGNDVVLVEDLAMNEKIAEIRAMAREARRSEEKKGEDETLNPGGGIHIEKEIEARLSNMEKRLNSQRAGLARLDGSRNDASKGKKSLMFDKKYKFKAEKPSSSGVKGFGGSKGEDELISVSDFDTGEKNHEEEQNEADSSSGAEQRQLSKEVNKSTKSGNQASRKPNMEVGSRFGKRTLLSGKHGEVTKGKPMRRAREKQSGKGNRVWWLKLPYVLRILMHSNIGGEITEGYFTIRTDSMEEKEGQVSHMIAFEDQNDARNLSYLLESFFEDLDDFSTNVVPVSTKDLLDEVGSGGKNVIVVGKSQLKLYAGQPFEDVERALHALIQEQR